jgi:regulator of telomere elongation helicase 1
MPQEGICADAASFDLPAAHLSACITEARQCVDLALTHRGRDNSSDTSIDPENFAILKGWLCFLFSNALQNHYRINVASA